MPPPEPRSSTVSPGFNWASAVGLPQPREALSALSGSWPASDSSYKLEVIGSQEEAAEPVQQDVVEQQSDGIPSPDETRRATFPYFSFTSSLISTDPPICKQ